MEGEGVVARLTDVTDRYRTARVEIDACPAGDGDGELLRAICEAEGGLSADRTAGPGRTAPCKTPSPSRA